MHGTKYFFNSWLLGNFDELGYYVKTLLIFGKRDWYFTWLLTIFCATDLSWNNCLHI